MHIRVLVAVSLLLGILASAACAQSNEKVIITGQAWVDSGYQRGWQPLFWMARETESDPGNLLFATKVADDQGQFGLNSNTPPLPIGAYDGLITTYVGSQVYDFDFDVYALGWGWSDDPALRLELWTGIPDFSVDGKPSLRNKTLIWRWRGPWNTAPQHASVGRGGGGAWGYEFRLANVPEPPALLALVVPMGCLLLRRRMLKRKV